MSFIGGLILGSMMSSKKHSHETYHAVPIDPQPLLHDFIAIALMIIAIIIMYLINIHSKRNRLKDAINNLVYCSSTTFIIDYLHPQRSENRRIRNRINRRIEVLEEEPIRFGSPLYFARLPLRKEIKSKLEELKIELANLESNA